MNDTLRDFGWPYVRVYSVLTSAWLVRHGVIGMNPLRYKTVRQYGSQVTGILQNVPLRAFLLLDGLFDFFSVV